MIYELILKRKKSNVNNNQSKERVKRGKKENNFKKRRNFTIFFLRLKIMLPNTILGHFSIKFYE